MILIKEEMKTLYLHARYLAMKGSRFLPNSKDHMSVCNKIREEINNAEKVIESSNEHKRGKNSVCRESSIDDDYYPTSIAFWPGQRMDKNKNSSRMKLSEKEREKFLSQEGIDFGCVKHASLCMLQCMIFPAIIPHATIPLCRGWRISMQIQIERQAYAGFFPMNKAENSTSGIRLKSIEDKENQLFCFIKHNVERILDSCLSRRIGKDNVLHKNGTKVWWLDMVSPGSCLLQKDKKTTYGLP